MNSIQWHKEVDGWLRKWTPALTSEAGGSDEVTK